MDDVYYLSSVKMGFVTILVQHSWSLQPKDTAKKSSKTPSQPSKEKNGSTSVRLTDIKSVAKLIERFNRSDSTISRKLLEVEIRDVLDRLARMSLQSSIPDTARIDQIRLLLKAVKERVTSDNIAQDKTRFYAAQGRISLVAYSNCKTRHLSDKALDILIEALDTNLLSSDSSESNCLYELIVQITQALQVSIDNARSQEPDTMRVVVDSHMERLLKALLLSIQRIGYFVDMESLVLTPDFSDSLHDICRELDMFKSDDPHIVNMIFTMHETIKWIIFKANGEESDDEAATLGIALSFVSHVIRMAPPANISQLQGAFEAILEELNSKSRWFLGKKFINLLGAAAMYHIDACKLFLGIVKHLRSLHWQWMYQSLLMLGTIVLTAESSQIRKIALEDGLLMYISFGQNLDQSSTFHKYTWTSRAACAIALNHIFTQRKTSSLGLLAHAALNARKVQESHQVVLNILKCGVSDLNRLSVLFKYTSRALAENYSESLDRLADLKKYLQHSKSLSSKASPKKKISKKTDVSNPYLKDLKLSVDAYHSNYKKNSSSLDQQKTLVKIATKPSSLLNSYSCPSKNDPPKTQITIPTAGTANRRKLFNPELTASAPTPELTVSAPEEPKSIKVDISGFDSESNEPLSKGIIVIPALK